MKYFCVSDIHSFGQILKRDLTNSGFDINNEEHTLIVCGDIFDRGPDTIEVYNFLMSIPKNRRILVRGNHENLYLALLEKDFPEKHDFHNGTVKTFCAIANIPEEYLDNKYWCKQKALDGGNPDDIWRYSKHKIYSTWHEVKSRVTSSEITAFIKDSSSWVNFYELKKYIFVHSFIPTKFDKATAGMDEFYYMSFGMTGPQIFDKNWRHANNIRWEDAAWGCPWKQFRDGLYKGRKTLVVGHWHTSDFYAGLDHVTEGKENCPIYNNHGLVGLDACTVLTNHINVFIVEE